VTEPARIDPGERRDVGWINAGIAGLLGRVAGTAPPHLFLTLGRHRRLFRGWLIFGGALMPGGRLRRRETEMVIIRVAHRRGCAYELEHHRRLGAKAGLTPADIDAILADGTEPDSRWSPRESTMLAAADELLAERNLSDETWAQLARHLDERELIEFSLLVGHYDMLATTIMTLRIQPDRPRR